MIFCVYQNKTEKGYFLSLVMFISLHLKLCVAMIDNGQFQIFPGVKYYKELNDIFWTMNMKKGVILTLIDFFYNICPGLLS